MGRHSQKAGKAKENVQRVSVRRSRARKPARTPSANPLAHVSIYVVVFCGGFFGTLLRYWLSSTLNAQPQIIGIHWGTFAANMLATFLYAFISAVLVAVSSAKAKELSSRGLGMGFCGGLSTMSTLALEIVGSQLGWAYAIISVLVGIIFAAFGAYLGSLIAAPRVQRMSSMLVSHSDDSVQPSNRSNRKHRHSGR